MLNLCFKIEIGSGLTPGNGCSQPTSCQTGPDRRKTVQEVHLTVNVVKTCILDVGGQKLFCNFHAE